MVKSKGTGWVSEHFPFKRGVFKAILCPQSSFWLSLIRSCNIWRLKKKLSFWVWFGRMSVHHPSIYRWFLSDKRRHQIIMNEIHDITKSMGLTLKPVKCKSISIRGGKSDDCTFAIGDVVLKSLKDAPEKFLGSNFTYKGKSKDIHEIVNNKLEGMMENIKKCRIRDEFKLKEYSQYAPYLWDTCWLLMNLPIFSWKNWIISTPMPLRVYSVFHQKILPQPWRTFGQHVDLWLPCIWRGNSSFSISICYLQ